MPSTERAELMTTDRKKYEVVSTVEVELAILPAHLTPEFMKDFSRSFWAVSQPSELYDYAARQCAQNSMRLEFFIEGLGAAKQCVRELAQPTEEFPVMFTIGFEDMEAEESHV